MTDFGIGGKRRISERIYKGRDNIHECGTTPAAIESDMAPSDVMRTFLGKKRWIETRAHTRARTSTVLRYRIRLAATGKRYRVVDKELWATLGYHFARVVDRVERNLLAAAREHDASERVCSGDVSHDPCGKCMG